MEHSKNAMNRHPPDFPLLHRGAVAAAHARRRARAGRPPAESGTGWGARFQRRSESPARTQSVGESAEAAVQPRLAAQRGPLGVHVGLQKVELLLCQQLLPRRGRSGGGRGRRRAGRGGGGRGDPKSQGAEVRQHSLDDISGGQKSKNCIVPIRATFFSRMRRMS